MNKIMAVALLALTASACTSEQVYNSTSEARAQQCAKLPVADQADCRAQARTSYGEMKKSRDETAAEAPRY